MIDTDFIRKILPEAHIPEELVGGLLDEIDRLYKANSDAPAPEGNSGIRVEITDESELHCLKMVLRARDPELPELEIFLHTTQAIDLVHKLSLAICELHHRDSELLLRLKQQTIGANPERDR